MNNKQKPKEVFNKLFGEPKKDKRKDDIEKAIADNPTIVKYGIPGPILEQLNKKKNDEKRS